MAKLELPIYLSSITPPSLQEQALNALFQTCTNIIDAQTDEVAVLSALLLRAQVSMARADLAGELQFYFEQDSYYGYSGANSDAAIRDLKVVVVSQGAPAAYWAARLLMDMHEHPVHDPTVGWKQVDAVNQLAVVDLDVGRKAYTHKTRDWLFWADQSPLILANPPVIVAWLHQHQKSGADVRLWAFERFYWAADQLGFIRPNPMPQVHSLLQQQATSPGPGMVFL